MRKVHENMASCLMDMVGAKSGNAEVRQSIVSDYFVLTYRGNIIASWDGYHLKITDAGWRTNTTKNYLNALPGVHIRQKNYEWYLNGEKWNGSLKDIIIHQKRRLFLTS